jgi:hypothetical protein
MTLTDLWSWLENLPIAMRIGESWWFPLLESIHVVSITFVFGSLLMVDLRLIGVAARSYAVSRMSNELVPWTWGAFVLSALTGVGLFITQANHYMDNPAFKIKIFLLALAGINMTLFHFGVFRNVANWDATTTPSSAKASGALSLFLWAGVMLAGRWVGHLS